MPGRRTLYLCDGRCGLVACKLLADFAIKLLEIPFGGTTQDGLVRLTTLRCRERPGYHSIAMIDDDVYSIEHAEELEGLLGIVPIPSAHN